MNKVFIIIGPSGSGKDTLVSRLVNTGNYAKLLSDATRDKRVNEIEGKDYDFISKDDFFKRLKNDEYFQYNDFAGNLYAYKKEELIKQIQDKNVFIISHPQAVMLITFFLKQKDIPYNTVYLDIPKKEGINRMINRGDSKDSINKRRREYPEFIWYKNKADIILDATKDIDIVIEEFLFKTEYKKEE